MDTPILFIIFNRPELSNEVFQQIRLIKPKKLYIAADGPRANIESDQVLCDQTRKIIHKIDWDCDVHKLFNESNLGIRYGVAKAIDWFFANEVEGIIIEDDCFADESFFQYCKVLLEKFREDEKVMLISGTNLKGVNSDRNESYFFSGFPRVWGWASWRRSWIKFDIEMKDWPKYRDHKWLQNKKDFHEDMRFMWENIFNDSFHKKINSWDHIWFYTIYKNNGLSVIPQINLVKNIGFGPNATHTIVTEKMDDPNIFGHLKFPISHPEHIERDKEFDSWIDIEYYKSRVSIGRRLLRRIPYLRQIWKFCKK